MASIHLHRGSFNAGELSPLMGDRFGVEKVQSGCRKLRNFYLHVHGPAFRRPGMEYMGASKSQTAKSRLFGFTFSTTTGFVLEFCPAGLKVWSNGLAVPLDAPVALPYAEAECFEVQGFQVNDVVYLAHANHRPRKLVRYTDTDWRLEEMAWKWPPMGDENVSATTLTVSGTAMTASAAIFVAGHVGSYWQIAHRRENSFAEIVAAVPTIAAATSTSLRVIGKWDLFTYGTWTTTLYLERETAAGTWEVVRSWSGKSDRNVISSGEEDEETNLRLRVIAGTSTAASGVAVPRFILEAADSKIFGLVKVDSVSSGTVAVVTVINPVQSTDPTPFWTEGAFSDVRGYARTVGAHGARCWFGGTEAESQRLWGSVVNDYENFRRSSLDDSSVSFAPAAQERNEINWIASQGDSMLFGTSGEEWSLGGDNKPITPVNVKIERQSRFGSAYLPAQMIDESVAFVSRGGRKLRRIGARSDTDTWSAPDLTVLAEHVTLSGIVQTAFSANPNSILWAVTADGRLLGMTYEQEQNVFGWHVHNTDGIIESVSVIYGGEVDEVWIAVLRTNGRSVERMDSAVFGRVFDAPKRLIYLDAAVRFESVSPVTTVSGLAHLEGRVVTVLADGAEQGQRSVVLGAISLDPAASTVIIGLPFESLLQTTRIEIPLADGTIQHRRFRTSRVGLYLHDSLGGEVADSEEGPWEKFDYREAAMPMDAPPPLYTGERMTPIDSTTRGNVDVVVRQLAPLPLNIGALTLFGDAYSE